MKDKSNFFSTLFVYFVVIFFSALGIRTIFIEPNIANKENENLKILSNRKTSIQKRSDEIFNSKLNEAKTKGYSNLSLRDEIVKFSTQIKYDKLKQQFQCINKDSSVKSISKDIYISSGFCLKRKYQRSGDCGNNDLLGDNYIQYRSKDENKINYHYPEIYIWEEGGYEERGLKKYNYYQILPYALFKDFQKIIVRYDHLTQSFDQNLNTGITPVTSEFDTSSVLLVNNFQRRCRGGY